MENTNAYETEEAQNFVTSFNAWEEEIHNPLMGKAEQDLWETLEENKKHKDLLYTCLLRLQLKEPFDAIDIMMATYIAVFSRFIKDTYEDQNKSLVDSEKAVEDWKKYIIHFGIAHTALLIAIGYVLNPPVELEGDAGFQFFQYYLLICSLLMGAIDLKIYKDFNTRNKWHNHVTKLKPAYEIVTKIRWDLEMSAARKLTE